MSGPNPNIIQPPIYSRDQNIYTPTTSLNRFPLSSNSSSGAPPVQQNAHANLLLNPAVQPNTSGFPNILSPHSVAQNNNSLNSQVSRNSPKPNINYHGEQENTNLINPSSLKSPFPSYKPDESNQIMQNGPFSSSSTFNAQNSGLNAYNTPSQINGVSAINQQKFQNPNVPSSPMQWGSQTRLPPPPPTSSTQQIATSSNANISQPGFNYMGVSPQPLADGKPVPQPSQVPSSAGLPLPYNSGYDSFYGNSSPQVTPGASQPTSTRSSRNPSPISTQRYDYMEGQFSNKPSPSNSSSNLQNMGPSAKSSLCPPNFQQVSGETNAQMTPHSVAGTPLGYSPRLDVTSNRYPIGQQPRVSTNQPLTPVSGSMRARYPQQIGYSQSPNQFASPAVNQANNLKQPSPTYNSQQSPYHKQQPQSPLQQNLPEGPVGGVEGYDPYLHAKMAGMSVHSSFSRLWGNDCINLLQDRNILPPVPLEAPKPVITPDRPNCSPNIFRCTLTKVPDTNNLLQKSRLPFGVLIHPFKDTSSLSIIQCNTIVRCRNCRTYVNPFVSFIDQRRWKCNLCFRINDLPEEFLYDPATKSYGDPARRPEIRNATIEFIAPSDYMLRPPQPASYLFLLDVSHGALETGYLATFCKIMIENLENIPGDSRTRIGFITFNGSIHFYNLGEGLNQPHMLVVSDVEDIFLPSPDSLLVNLHESKSLIIDLLNDLPKRFETNGDINNCLGSALQAAYKLLSPIGGRVTVIQTCLPNHGPGALKNREDPNQRAAKDVSNIGPATDFYKKLALDCSGQQTAVDLFLLCSQYADVASISCISKFSAGCLHYYPGFHHQLGKIQVEKFSGDLKRYLTRKIGFEAVMRIRCTRGLSIHTFHGNFFVRSTDLLSLPNVNPDAGYGMQISIDENLTECNTVCFQAAVLYTSSNGERRIRVHTLSLPITSTVQDVLGGADQETIIGLVAKMAVDRSVASSLSDARDALINVCLDVLSVYKNIMASQVAGALMIPYSTRLLPLFILALLKHVAFRTGVSTKLDERVFAMDRMKTLPLSYLIRYIYPALYPVHALDDKNAIYQDDDITIIPQPVILQLSSEKIDRHGAYILDNFDFLYLYIGRAISDHFCINVLDVPNFSAIPEEMSSLPELSTPESDRLRNFVSWLQDQRPYHSPLQIIREDSKNKHLFQQYMLDDRTESLFSYYEFLQHIRQQISK